MSLSALIICLLISINLIIIEGQNTCGISGTPSGLVVNGTVSQRGAWPWTASIHKIEGDQFFCGGTLIATNIVLTAAHCIQNKKSTVPRHPNEIAVKLGKYDLSQPLERGSVTAYPYEIKVHPDWKFYSDNFDADIAIIILETKVQITSAIFPICLGNKNDAPKQTKGVVVGWGMSESGTKHENIPRQLEISVKTNEDCFLKNPRFALISSRNTFCAGKDEHSGPCNGDSGSGMFIRSDERNSKWFLKGIVSASFVNNGICDVSDDAIFTNVYNYIDWITEVATNAKISLPSITGVTPTARPDKEIFCFFEGWAEGREGDGAFSLYDFKPELCTTAVYLLANLEGDNLKSVNPWQELDVDGGQDLYKRFTGLKQLHPHLRVLLAVGGWVDGSKKYSQLAADSNRRKRFARNSAEYLKKYGFDGLHFHWEHPAHRGGEAVDKQNFVHLLKELNNVYKPQKLYLSAFLRPQKFIVEKAYDVKNIAKFVDAVLMMGFDYGGPWENRVGFHSPLHGHDENNVESRVGYFLNLGVPAEKLILGIGFHGRTFVTPGSGEIGATTKNNFGFQGPFVKENGYLGYNEICRLQKENSWDVRFNSKASEAIGKFQKDGSTHVVTFPTPRSVANKVKFAIEKNLGGVWAWFVDTDDYRGECIPDLTTFSDFPQTSGPRKEKDFPLLRTINEAMELLSSNDGILETDWRFSRNFKKR